MEEVQDNQCRYLSARVLYPTAPASWLQLVYEDVATLDDPVYDDWTSAKSDSSGEAAAVPSEDPTESQVLCPDASTRYLGYSFLH